MKLIPLINSEQMIQVDDDRYEKLSRFKWKLTDRGIHTRWMVNGRFHHMMIQNAVIGKPKKGFETDHKDRNRFNNQRDNLRHCTHVQNSQNRAGWGKAGVKGVYFNPYNPNRPWRATITVNGKIIRIGHFKSLFEAAAAYNHAACRHFGEFAVLNPL